MQRQQPVSYDFKRANKLSHLHMRSLLRISEKVSRQLGNQLTQKLDTYTSGSPGTVQLKTYEELSQQLCPLAVVIVCSFPPLKGEFQLIVSNLLVQGCTERLLGGDDIPHEEKELTDIDKVLIRQLAEEWLDLYADAISLIAPLKAQFQEINLAHDYNFPVHQRERVMVLETKIQLGQLDGSMELILPSNALEELLPFLTTPEQQRPQTEADMRARQLIESGIYETDLTVQAVLGRCELDVRDLLALQQGDVLRLSTSIDELIPVYVDQKLLYKGQVGLHRGKRAVQIVAQEDHR
ncbi:flagellar motor switch protein FliM [Chryseomicrobium excrementi]|nr:FliM/FliN family flagellar motor switch protein [Chryseomicrobium excrementi]